MPSELSIPTVQPLPGPSEAVAAPKATPAAPGPAERAVPAAQPYANPTLRLDPALGLVVIEFRDDAGALTSTIPSQRQIEAYRTHQQAIPQRAGAPPARDHDEAAAAAPNKAPDTPRPGSPHPTPPHPVPPART